MLRNLLSSLGLHPLVHMIRHTVVHEFVDHVQERTRRNRKNTLKYTIGDTARRCRKTDPPVAARHVRSVITTLFQAGALLHADGNPVRSNSAPFRIDMEPEELLELLLRFYLKTLGGQGVSLDDPTVLSQLFYADDKHVEDLVALVKTLDENTDAVSDASSTDATEKEPTQPVDESPTDQAPA